MKKEDSSLLKNGTYEKVKELPRDKKNIVLPSRYVYATKRSGDRKSRMVAGGHRQAKVTDSSSPTLDINSLKMFLSVAISKDYYVTCIDFSSACLNADIDEEIYLLPLMV